MNTRSLVTGVALVAGLTLAGAGSAAAQEQQPAPVTVTLSPEQVTFLCEQRLPNVEKRTAKLVERINGGADVKGSTEWLKAKAQKEREAGRENIAKALEERATKRAGKIDQLNKVKGWASEFRGKYCGGK